MPRHIHITAILSSFASIYTHTHSALFSLYFQFIYFFCVICNIYQYNKIKNGKMPRCLRSGSRRKKLQVQHIHQVNKTLRVSINNCIEANVVNFNQIEFLSLFGLTQIGQSNGMKNGQKTHCDGHIKRTRPTASSTNDYSEAFKMRFALGKYPNTIYRSMTVRCKVIYDFLAHFCGLAHIVMLIKLLRAAGDFSPAKFKSHNLFAFRKMSEKIIRYSTSEA